MSNIQVNFGDILLETSKNSAFWDMGVDSHLKWLLLFSPDEAGELGRHQSMKGEALTIGFVCTQGLLIALNSNLMLLKYKIQYPNSDRPQNLNFTVP